MFDTITKIFLVIVSNLKLLSIDAIFPTHTNIFVSYDCINNRSRHLLWGYPPVQYLYE